VVRVWAIKGRIVALSDDAAVAPSESATFAGTVWIADNGRIAAVTKGDRAGPDGSQGANVVDVGSSLVLPGFIDLHNHLAYNTLPLWDQPGRTEPFAHHNTWPTAKTYARSVTWPAYAFVTASPEELLAYVETKAIVGGTTTIQGSPPKNRPREGVLVRNLEDEKFGSTNANLIYASTLTAKPSQLASRANKMRDGATFIYHCAEGRQGTIVAHEYNQATDAGCLQSRFVAIHANAVATGGFSNWTTPGAIAWSPFSNLWLYGATTDVPSARDRGISVCLGSDWAPSGTKHVLGEAKVARLVSDANDWGLSNEDIVRMMTCVPGDVLARSWPVRVGRLQPDALADITIIAAKAGVNAFKAVVEATEADVEGVVINGVPRYGTRDFMTAASTSPVTSPATEVSFDGQVRMLALTRPDDPAQAWQWSDVVGRLEEVRAHPKQEILDAQALLGRASGRLDEQGAPLRLALDMPTGVAPVGGLPKDLDDVVVPELETLTHDGDWLDSLHDRGFHEGLLDGLAGFYGAAWGRQR